MSGAATPAPPGTEARDERLWARRADEARLRALHPADYARYDFAAGFAAGARVLDCACGAGYGSELLARAGARAVVGVDGDAAAVTWAAREFGGPGRTFVQGDAASLPLEDAAVDLAVSLETLEHLDDPAPFLAELARVLRPGGRLVLSTPLDESPRRLAPLDPFHRREYGWDELGALLARHFTLERRLGQHGVASARYAALAGAPVAGAALRAGLHRLLPAPLRALARQALGLGGVGRAWISEDGARTAPVQLVVARRPG